MISKRLSVTMAYKAAGAIPKILYLGHDADEAINAFEAAKDKGYFEIRVCRDFDATPLKRWRAEPVQLRQNA